MNECNICCENFNTKKRKEIKCPYCSKSACMTCHMEYFMNNTEPANCMYKCEESIDIKEDGSEVQKSWNVQYLTDNFPKTFIWGQGTNAKGATEKTKKSYRQHREENLLEQQIALMLVTQIEVTRDAKIKKLKQENKLIRDEFNEKYRKNYNWRWKQKTEEETYFEHRRRINKLYGELVILRNKLYELNQQIRKIKNEGIEDEDDEEEEKIINRGHCPNCVGFISEGWKCGLCDTKICSKCKEEITKEEIENHQETLKMKKKGQEWVSRKIHCCDENILATVQELKNKNYKKCPCCRVYIEKNIGCNQMWCTHCNIFFDWRTGKEIKKTTFVHNPHYQEWLEQGGQQDGQRIREEIARIGDCDVNEYTVRHLGLKYEYSRSICNIIHYINEIRDQVEYSNTLELLDNSLLKLRKRYLRGEYGKDINKAKTKLAIHTQRAYKRESKNNEAYQIRDMFADASFQIIARFILEVKNKKKNKQDLDLMVEETIKQVKEMYDYANKNMVALGKRYNSGTLTLNNWDTKIPDCLIN